MHVDSLNPHSNSQGFQKKDRHKKELFVEHYPFQTSKFQRNCPGIFNHCCYVGWDCLHALAYKEVLHRALKAWNLPTCPRANPKEFQKEYLDKYSTYWL